MNVTVIIVVITCVVSFVAFSNQRVIDALIFNPPAIFNRNEWYRFFSCGLIHADIMHLAFNMFSFYVFGKIVEQKFADIFGEKGPLLYGLMYIAALGACLVPTYMQHKENYHYRSLGASGAVSAVVFAGIFLYPTLGISLMFIPIAIPGFIFGPLYLIITAYLSRRGQSYINHSAHLWGALFGIAFLIVISFTLSAPPGFNPLTHFIDQIKGSYF
jgi:membrane associated rhomboid family serine protease